MNQLKNNSISASLKNTRERRSRLACKTYELKLDLSSLSKIKLNSLNLMFQEAKYLYNHILAMSEVENAEGVKDFDIFKFNPLIKIVNILDKDKNKVEKELTMIGSQIKQSVHNRMLDSIKALSKSKKSGNKIGKLKFKSHLNSIPLKQFDVTYKIHQTKKNYVKLQNIKGYFKVNGMKQIPSEAEFANATLVKRNKNFYLMITAFVSKAIHDFQEKSVGIDFGIESTITLSTGEKFKVNIPEEHRTKKLRHALSRKQGSKKKSKKSKSYLKTLQLVNASIEKVNNKKKDIKNKIVSQITKRFETICVQDESIKQWKDGNFGKQVHNSILGGIMSDLQRKSHTFKIVGKYVPTTQICRNCFKLNKHSLKERTYTCEFGYSFDRDIHSAKNIEDIGLGRMNYDNKFLEEHKESKTRMEGLSSYISAFGGNIKTVSMNSEAHDFSRG